MSTEIENAMKALTEAMQDTELGSYAHGWHCNIAIACYDAMYAAKERPDLTHNQAHAISNDAASRFMKLCFDVETKNT